MQFNFELKRKSFHLCAIIMPFLYLWVSKSFIVTSLCILTVCVLYLDISRHYNPKIRELTSKFFLKIMREEEKNIPLKLSGASFMMSGFLLSAIFFSKGLAITAWLILIISDCLAALIGTRIGVALENGKSIAGVVTFFITAFCISLICNAFIGYNTSFPIIILSCIITTAAEFYSKNISIDDNLLIPLTYGFATEILNYL